VKEGDVILELDKAQEALETQRRKLMWLDQSEFRAASNRVDTLRRDLASTRQLFETTKSVSADDMDKKELEFKLASAEMERLRTSEFRESLEYRMAEEQLRRRDLTAPMSGTITKIETEVGEYCEPRQPLVRLVDPSRFYFVGNVSESVGQRLRTGQSVVLHAGEGPAAVEVTGKICFVSPTIDPASGLLAVKAEFDNPEGKVRPGTAAELFIEVIPHGD